MNITSKKVFAQDNLAAGRSGSFTIEATNKSEAALDSMALKDSGFFGQGIEFAEIVVDKVPANTQDLTLVVTENGTTHRFDFASVVDGASLTPAQAQQVAALMGEGATFTLEVDGFIAANDVVSAEVDFTTAPGTVTQAGTTGTSCALEAAGTSCVADNTLNVQGSYKGRETNATKVTDTVTIHEPRIRATIDKLISSAKIAENNFIYATLAAQVAAEGVGVAPNKVVVPDEANSSATNIWKHTDLVAISGLGHALGADTVVTVIFDTTGGPRSVVVPAGTTSVDVPADIVGQVSGVHVDYTHPQSFTTGVQVSPTLIFDPKPRPVSGGTAITKDPFDLKQDVTNTADVVGEAQRPGGS